MVDSHNEEFIFIRYNQNNSCFTTISNTGKVSIYNTFPSKGCYGITTGNYKIVEMFYNSNIVFLVGNSDNPNSKYSNKKVLIWNDYKCEEEGEMCFKEKIQNIKIRTTSKRNLLIVVLYNKIYIFNFPSFELMTTFDTFPNPEGLLGLSNLSDNLIIAYQLKQGKIGVLYIENDKHISTLIDAHNKPISKLAICEKENLIASTSINSKYIRVHGLKGELLYEFSRGVIEIEIFGLEIYNNNIFCHDKNGYLKVCKMSQENKAKTVRSSEKKISSKWNISNIINSSIKYLDSEGCIDSIYITSNQAVFKMIDDKRIINRKGGYFKLEFDPKNMKFLELKKENVFNMYKF